MTLQGFFSRHELTQVKRPPSLAPRCGLCRLWERCSSPKMPVGGEGRKGILLIGEAPGRNEDAQGKQFVGESGKLLRNRLDAVGIDMDRDCWRTNSLICWPWEKDANGIKQNRTPTNKEIDWCRPNLTRTIKELNPRIIIPLGGAAVRSLVGPLFADNPGPIGRWVGWRIPSQQLNAWLCPTWHPSYLLRSEHDAALQLLFREHLRDAVACEGRPWPNGPPDWGKQVERIIDTDAAAGAIRSFASDRPFAWDIESDRLKPDHPDARIVCCSISNGKRTVAFPWHGKARQTMMALLRGDTPKIGYSAKFETRWLLAREGVRVRNWVWDGMLAAHTLDNRGDICSLDFQAFVRLGFGDWHSHVGPWLKSKKPGGNSVNRVRELDLPTLLRYCALDSLVEWHVAEHQRKEMGIEA